MHTQNLQADPRSSLLVTDFQTQRGSTRRIPSHGIGNTQRLPSPIVLKRGSSTWHATATANTGWILKISHFYRMDVVDLYYVGGFGVMGWVEAPQYRQAQPDPLSDTAAEIIRHMNNDHSDALVLLAKAFAGIEAQEAKMTAVDRLGFNVRLKTPERMRGARIIFFARFPIHSRHGKFWSKWCSRHAKASHQGHAGRASADGILPKPQE